mmetsp:Transcript_30368/g.48731  ORF Transcript_30368/g.48731 Transcript_30368/m.48731 type:complete len:119 (+) Transcript_30368:1076-1432(+)
MAPYIIDSNGSHTLTNALQVDTLLHLMSQMLFLSRYPGKVHYLGQTENMKESISFVKKELLGLENIPDTEVRRNNVHESSGSLALSRPQPLPSNKWPFDSKLEIRSFLWEVVFCKGKH